MGHRSWIAIALGTQLFAAACGSDDDACPSRTVADFCQDSCVRNLDEAVEYICKSHVGDTWVEAKNDCGGQSVRSNAALLGVMFNFDGKDQLIGVESWTDFDEDGCGLDKAYGRSCGAAEVAEHDCPTATTDRR